MFIIDPQLAYNRDVNNLWWAGLTRIHEDNASNCLYKKSNSLGNTVYFAGDFSCSHFENVCIQT